MEGFKVIQGGKPSKKVYKGLRGMEKEKQIVAASTNEAYALFLDSEYGNDIAEISVELEEDKLVLRGYKNQPVGVY